MKAIRTHDYRIDRVRECEVLSKSILAAAIRPSRLAAFCGRISHELGKERVAVFLGLHGPFSGRHAASRRRG
jgi:hypothetical protein